VREKLRQVLLINPRFQFAVLGFCFAVTFGSLATVYFFIHRAFSQLTALSQTLDVPHQHPFFHALALNDYTVGLAFLITGIFAAVTIGSIGLVITLRAAGPVDHLCRHLKRVNNGETLEDVQFRKDDYFHELAGSVNHHLAQHRELSHRQNVGTPRRAA
jgi:hypothetical protein